MNPIIRSPTLCQQHAVSGLLEEGEKKTINPEQWNTPSFKQKSKHPTPELDLTPKCESKKGYRISKKSVSPQKDLEKQRLKQLLNERYSGLEPEIAVRKQPPDSEQPHQSIKWGRLRAFDSQLTFYSQQKQMKMVSSSMNFYHRISPEEHRSKSPLQPLDAIKKSENKLPPQHDESTNVILFKPNRSETIRELINHMGRERGRNKQIVLNSTHCPPQTPGQVESPYQQSQQPQYLRQYERRVMNHYKNFVPFREDDRLLFGKVMEQDNIWKRRFKQSWSRKKKQQETRKTYFKALVVHD